jgi:hypothetical protein
MKLHEVKNAFRVLLDDVHTKTGYRADVLEKDYYVVLILKELAGMQNDGLPAYFKGGTALYKALKTTNRFSEDIDLSVDTRECSRTQNDKRLERAAKKYVSLQRDPAQGKTNRSELISVYTYEPVAGYDRNDALQRFGKLKVEATSFSISEPFERLGMCPFLFLDLRLVFPLLDHDLPQGLFADQETFQFLQLFFQQGWPKIVKDGVPNELHDCLTFCFSHSMVARLATVSGYQSYVPVSPISGN